ncbi:MAG: dehydrogenase [Planctomycetaceae bacterium]|jgi:predicted dehydrogenase|nr:dehydrogenase [Planctomycetaceae bacterium]MBP63886.1 dehydrogenase [Planctomycetaceae bacterium]
MDHTNRRTFFQQTGRNVAGVTSGVLLASTRARAGGANERIRVGVIGCGGQGKNGHIGLLPRQGRDNAEIVYVCDPDEKRRMEAATLAGGAKPVGNLRTILDDKSIDAVTIATPDHWHAPAALLALDAGKHVYVEKPCSHNLREGRLLVEAVRRTGKIVQHGTQARSDRGFIEAIQMIRDGVIGDVLIAKAWNIQRRRNIGHAQPSRPPSGFDYDMWVGPAPMMPFQKNRHHYSWHWWYNFGTGDLGNDGTHEFDMARWGLGLNTHPTSVAVCGGKYFFDDDQQFPDTVTATFEYPGDGKVGSRKQLIFEMKIWSTNYPHGVDGGVEFWGTEGTMFVSRRGKFELRAERNQKLDTMLSKRPEMDVKSNLRVWLAAIRGDSQPTADAQTAHLSASLPHLANTACRVGRSFQFDPVNEKIVGDEQANQLLSRKYREGHWAVPKDV